MTSETPTPRDRAIAALVAQFKTTGTPYDPADPADFSCNIVFRAGDGINSIRALTFGEVVDALLASPDILRDLTAAVSAQGVDTPPDLDPVQDELDDLTAWAHEVCEAADVEITEEGWDEKVVEIVRAALASGGAPPTTAHEAIGAQGWLPGDDPTDIRGTTTPAEPAENCGAGHDPVQISCEAAAEIVRLRAEVKHLDDDRAILADRCQRKDLELDELRALLDGNTREVTDADR